MSKERNSWEDEEEDPDMDQERFLTIKLAFSVLLVLLTISFAEDDPD